MTNLYHKYYNISLIFQLFTLVVMILFTLCKLLGMYIPLSGQYGQVVWLVQQSINLFVVASFLLFVGIYLTNHRQVPRRLLVWQMILILIVTSFLFVPNTETTFQNIDRVRLYYELDLELPMQMQNYEWYQTEPSFLGDGIDSLTFSLEPTAFNQWKKSVSQEWQSGPAVNRVSGNDIGLPRSNTAFDDLRTIEFVLFDRTPSPTLGYENLNTTTIEIDNANYWVRVIHYDS